MSFAVFASAKSGTTWVQHMLSAHPEAHCGETRALGDYLSTENPSGIHISLEKFVGLLARHSNPPVAFHERHAYHRTLLWNLMDTIAETALRATGGRKRVYGEKITPFLGTGMQVVEGLAEYHPGLRFIHLVRDGRDVIVSGFVQRSTARVARGGADADEHRDLLERRRVSEAEFVFFRDLWIESVRAGMAARERFPAWLLVRYEAMLEDPAREVRRMLEFIGLDASEASVRTCVEAGRFERLSGGRTRGQEDRSSFFRKGEAGDWQAWLTDEQVERFQAAAAAAGVASLI